LVDKGPCGAAELGFSTTSSRGSKALTPGGDPVRLKFCSLSELAPRRGSIPRRHDPRLAVAGGGLAPACVSAFSRGRPRPTS